MKRTNVFVVNREAGREGIGRSGKKGNMFRMKSLRRIQKEKNPEHI